MEPSKKPLNVLVKKIGNPVVIHLKSGSEYWGKMERVDGYMNIMLKEAKEYNSGVLLASYGDIFIRGNNILYICIDPDGPPKPKISKEITEDEEEE